MTNDDFGDTSALLITLESDTRSYRELKGYMDDLSDRLRRIESVSNLRPYGVQQEQISVYADHDRLAPTASARRRSPRRWLRRG